MASRGFGEIHVHIFYPSPRRSCTYSPDCPELVDNLVLLQGDTIQTLFAGLGLCLAHNSTCLTCCLKQQQGLDLLQVNTSLKQRYNPAPCYDH